MTDSPALVVPSNTVSLPALGPGARGAAFTLNLSANRTSLDIAVDNLPPQQQLGAIGTVYVDNTGNAANLVITFPDTSAEYTVPADSGAYVFAMTGSQRFTIKSVVSAPTTVGVQVINRVVAPSGVQPIGGTVTVANPGPVNGGGIDRSANLVAQSATQIMPSNPNRKFMLAQMPETSDGYWSVTGGALPGQPGSFYAGPGEKFPPGADWVPTGPLVVWTTNGGLVVALEG